MSNSTNTPSNQDFAQWLDERLTQIEQAPFEAIRTSLRPINDWLAGLPPWTWHAAAVGLFALSAAAVLLIPRRFIYAGAPDQHAWRDLRWWTILALIPYMIIYSIL
jgi:hypothetical protein